MIVPALLALGTIAAVALLLKSNKREASYEQDSEGVTRKRPARLAGWIPWIGMGLEWGNDSNGLMSRCRKAYGDVFTLFMGGQEMTIMVEPVKGIPSVYRNTKTLSFNPVLVHMMKTVFGVPAAISEDVELGKTLHKQYIQYLSTSTYVTELTESYLRHFEEGINAVFGKSDSSLEVEDLWNWIDYFVFQCALKTLFGTKLDPTVLYNDFKLFDKDFPNLSKNYPEFLVKNGVAARNRVNSVVKEWLERGIGEDCSTLMKEREKYFNERGFSQEAKAALNTSFMWGLQGNSNPTIFWCISHIITSPGLLKQVREQTEQALKEKPSDNLNFAKLFDAKALTEIPILKAIFSEALRVHASVFSIRNVQSDTVVETEEGDYLMKKGENVIINARLIHMDGEIHKNPEEFNHNRFYNNNLEDAQIVIGGNSNTTSSSSQHTKNGKNVKHHLIPFGGGQSLCPGRFFASNEAVSTVAVLTYFLDFEVLGELPSNDYSRAGLGILWADKPLKVNIKRRTQF